MFEERLGNIVFLASTCHFCRNMVVCDGVRIWGRTMQRVERIIICFVHLQMHKMGDFYEALQLFFLEKWQMDQCKTEDLLNSMLDRGLIAISFGHIILGPAGKQSLQKMKGKKVPIMPSYRIAKGSVAFH